MKKILLCALCMLSTTTPALAQQVTTINSAPSDGFHYGTGNDYSPANAVVGVVPPNPAYGYDGSEIALRFHQTFQPAPASDASGVYSFALGTNPISYDWSADGSNYSAMLTLTNLLTGATVSYNPFGPGNDNYTTSTDVDLAQNSNRLSYLPLGFDPNVNDTYKATFTSGGASVTAYAKIGSGFTPPVPEPATWAMMLLGFGGIGFAMRRKRVPVLSRA